MKRVGEGRQQQQYERTRGERNRGATKKQGLSKKDVFEEIAS